MSTVDPNVYALSVQLQLDADDAFKTLDSFSDKLIEVEKNISNAASEALSSVNNAVKTLNTSLDDVISKTKDITSAAQQVEANFTTAGESATTNVDTATEQAKLLKQEIERTKEIVDLHDQIIEHITKEFEMSRNIVETIQEFYGHLKKKNKGHKEEKDAVQKELDLWGIMKKLMGDSADGVYEVYKNLTYVLRVLEQIGDTIAKAAEIQEQFVTNNYRLYGSMEGIVQDVRALSYEYGVLEKEAIEAYKALAEVRTPREEIDKMAHMIVGFNRVTGVSMDNLAEYSKRMRALGGDTASLELHLNRMQDGMRKFGLSMQEMNRIMGDTSVSLADLHIMLGDDKAVAAFNELKVAAEGMAKGIGYSGEEMSKQLNAMVSDTGTMAKMMRFAGKEGLRSAEGMEKALLDSADAWRANYESVKASGNKNSVAVKKGMEAIAASMGHVSTESMKITMEMAKLREEMGADWTNMTDALEIVDKRMWESYNATQRFARSWEDLKEAVSLVFKELWNFVGILLVPAIRWLAWFANMLAYVINRMVAFYDYLRNEVPVLGWFIQMGEKVIGFLLALVIVIGVVIMAFTGLGTAMKGLTSVFTGGFDVVGRVTSMLTNIIDSIGQVISAVFKAIGNAINALANAVKGNIPALLALGAAMLMTGVGVWFMFQGFKALEGVSWGTIAGGLVIMAVAIGLITAAVYILATSIPVAVAVYPILLAIGAALLMIGAAAWLMGMGIKLAAEGLVAIHAAVVEPGSPPLYLVLPILAAGILMVGWAALAGAPGLILLTWVMVAVAFAARMITPAFQALAAIIQNLSAEQIVAFSQALLGASLMISLAVLALVPAVVLVVSIAPLLMIAGWVLLIAGAAFSVAAIMIGYGAGLLGDGMKSLGEGAKEFQGVNFVAMAGQLWIGGLLLVSGGSAFIIGATLVGIGAILLGYGLQALGPGAKTLEDVDFADMAFDLMIGGFLLVVAGSAFIVGATLVGSGALILGLGLLLLGKGAQTLKDVDFSEIASQLAKGGIYLAIAGSLFSTGATLIGLAAMTLGTGLWMLGKGADQLADLDFTTLSRDLMMGAAWLMKAAWPLLYAAMILVPAGFAILAIGLSLWAGGNMVKFGALALLIGSRWLAEAANNIYMSALYMSEGADELLIGSTKLWKASAALAALGLSLGVTAGTLTTISGPLRLALAGLAWAIRGFGVDDVDPFYRATLKLRLASNHIKEALRGVSVDDVKSFDRAVSRLESVSSNLQEALEGFDVDDTLRLKSVSSSLQEALGGFGVDDVNSFDLAVSRLKSVSSNLQEALGGFDVDDVNSFALAASRLKSVSSNLQEALGGFDVDDVNSFDLAVSRLKLVSSNLQEALGGFDVDDVNSFDLAVSRLESVSSNLQEVLGGFDVDDTLRLKLVSSNLQEALGGFDVDDVNSFDLAVSRLESVSSNLQEALGGFGVDDVNSFALAASRLKSVSSKLREAFGGFGVDDVNPFYLATLRLKSASINLREAFGGLSVSAVSGLDGLGDQLDTFAGVLDRYADRIEAVANRINTAIMTKVIPAMAAAEAAGMEEAIKSEAITQVQVMLEKEGEEETTDLIEETNIILRSIDSRLEAMAVDTTVTSILDVLNSILPAIQSSDGESGLSSEMNAWMK